MKFNLDDIVIYKGVSTACGEIGPIVGLHGDAIEMHRMRNKRRMKCPDSRCQEGCVICRIFGDKKQFEKLTPEEIAIYFEDGWKFN